MSNLNHRRLRWLPDKENGEFRAVSRGRVYAIREKYAIGKKVSGMVAHIHCDNIEIEGSPQSGVFHAMLLAQDHHNKKNQ